MCVISRPVKTVTATNILVARLSPESNRQLTIYENSVYNAKPKNAMIIAVPDPSTVEFHDLSKSSKFFQELDKYFESMEERDEYMSMTLNSMPRGKSRSAPLIKVERVGDYNVSLVPSLQDLTRVDPSYFILSSGAKELLQNYPPDWGFIVFGLSDDISSLKKYSPFAFSHTILSDNRLYIPTMHYHDEEASNSDFVVSSKPKGQGLPSWKHAIYIYGIEDENIYRSHLPMMAAGSAYGYERKKNVYRCVNTDCLLAFWPESITRLTIPRSNYFKKFVIDGQRENMDLFIPITTTPVQQKPFIEPTGRIGTSEEPNCVIS